MSSLWEKETQPSLPVSSTECVSEEQKKAPIDATDSGKGADQPNSCCPERSHPETSVDHAKGSSCPEPIVDQPCSLPVSHKPAMFEEQRTSTDDSTLQSSEEFRIEELKSISCCFAHGDLD
ncbi:unnamed protein product [Arctogadus glacialis]